MKETKRIIDGIEFESAQLLQKHAQGILDRYDIDAELSSQDFKFMKLLAGRHIKGPTINRTKIKAITAGMSPRATEGKSFKIVFANKRKPIYITGQDCAENCFKMPSLNL